MILPARSTDMTNRDKIKPLLPVISVYFSVRSCYSRLQAFIHRVPNSSPWLRCKVMTDTWENKLKNTFWTEQSKGFGNREGRVWEMWLSSVNKEQRRVQLVCNTLPDVVFRIIVCNYSHLTGAEFRSHVDDIAAVTVGEVTSGIE